MAFNEEMMKEMDQAAEKAEAELKQGIGNWTASALISWWARWYMKAGHKRLGRLLVSIAKSKGE